MPTVLIERPTDATLSVTKAARLLGVHPNTIRAWSDQGRLRYYRINPRGDRRYRLGDLERFLDDAEGRPIGPLRIVETSGSTPARKPGGRARMSAGQRAGLPSRLEVVGRSAARDLDRMVTWAAQLQSIQQLGSRLSRLTSGREIGMAIATELHELIDYHNVRVYRVEGDDLVPVAFSGQVGEYVGETPEQLRIGRSAPGSPAGSQPTASPRYLPDAARDPRAETIPGTEDDLEESMLLAPMTFDDTVIGVLVLSKLGLDQFSEDDLRLLEIYASLAAQAFANADSTELLRQRRRPSSASCATRASCSRSPNRS